MSNSKRLTPFRQEIAKTALCYILVVHLSCICRNQLLTNTQVSPLGWKCWLRLVIITIRTMFSANRVFSERNNRTGQIEWFFEAREGIMGPYDSAASANKALDEFKERCIRLGCDGGRTSESKGNLKLAQDASGLNTLEMDPIKEK